MRVAYCCVLQAATLGGLQAAIAASPFAIPVPKQRIIRFKSDGNAAVLSDPSKVLVKDCNVWSGEDVVCEVGAVCWCSLSAFASDSDCL